MKNVALCIFARRKQVVPCICHPAIAMPIMPVRQSLQNTIPFTLSNTQRWSFTSQLHRVPRKRGSHDYQANTNVEKHRARKWGRVMIFCASGNAFHPEKRKTTDFQNWVQAWGSDLLLNQISSLVLRQEKELL
jgi:hypothetical protein